MTDYCASSDVVANMKGVAFSATSTPTATALADMISQESAVIDAHLTRYTLPIAGAAALLFLEKICIDLVVYRVTKVLAPKAPPQVAPDGKTMQDISHASAYREAMRMLKALMKGEMTLPGETLTSTKFFSSTAVDCDEEMTVDYSETQW